MTQSINFENLAQLKAAMSNFNIEVNDVVTYKYNVTIEFANIYNQDGSHMTTNVVVFAEDENEAIDMALYEKRGLKHLGYQFGKATAKVA